MKHTASLLSLILMLALGLPAAAQTERKPLWEVGAGMAYIDFPVYRGAKERRSYLLPVPYLAYNGEVFQVNRERVRGLIFRKDRVVMDVSVNGSVPAKSKDSPIRAGMPDLDPTLEIGPSLNFHVYFSEDYKRRFDIRLPIRGVIASDFKRVKDVGWMFQPQAIYDFNDIHGTGWNIGIVGGPMYANRRYHGYFYDVKQRYATNFRPAYTASGGYAGSQFIFALNKRHKDYWSGGFIKWDDLRHAKFANSPLVTSKRYLTFGWAITWILGKSDQMVDVYYD